MSQRAVAAKQPRRRVGSTPRTICAHARVILSGMYLVLFAIDRVNTSMMFIDYSGTRALLCLLFLLCAAEQGFAIKAAFDRVLRRFRAKGIQRKPDTLRLLKHQPIRLAVAAVCIVLGVLMLTPAPSQSEPWKLILAICSIGIIALTLLDRYRAYATPTPRAARADSPRPAAHRTTGAAAAQTRPAPRRRAVPKKPS